LTYDSDHAVKNFQCIRHNITGISFWENGAIKTSGSAVAIEHENTLELNVLERSNYVDDIILIETALSDTNMSDLYNTYLNWSDWTTRNYTNPFYPEANSINGTYIQAKFHFETDSTSYSPSLYNYTIGYADLTTPAPILKITDPTTLSPKEVNASDNITISFNVTRDNVVITSGVTINNITINGTPVDILTTIVCTGTLDCSVYSTESGCNNCSECNWTAGIIPIYDDFEDSFGNWSATDTNWTIGNQTPSSSTGSQVGGVGGTTTNFTFVETSSSYCNVAGQETILTLTDTQINWGLGVGDNITFYTNFYGTDIGTMHLEENSTNSWVSLWSLSGDDGNSGMTWTFQSVDASSLTGMGSLRFRYICDGGFRGDASIDRVNITNSQGCSNVGDCSSCSIDECDTNCSSAGCSQSTSQQFGYTSLLGWQVNITVPDLAVGTYDLFVNVTYDTDVCNDTEADAINYSEVDTTPPTITNLKNTSTLNVSTDVEFDCDEGCNYTMYWYNSSNMTTTYQVGFVSNNTFTLDHIQNISGLINHSTYSVNLSVWDILGNGIFNDTFNFTTRQNIVALADTCSCPSPAANWNVDCDDNCSITSSCDISDYNLTIGGGDGFFELLADIYVNKLILDLSCNFIETFDDGHQIIISHS